MSYSFRVTFNSQGQGIVTNADGDLPAEGAYFYVAGHGAGNLGVSLQGADGSTVLQAGAFCPAAQLPAAPAPPPPFPVAPFPAAPAPAGLGADPTLPDPVPVPAEMQAAYADPAPSSAPAAQTGNGF